MDKKEQERVFFDGQWWWRPLRSGDHKVTMAIKSAGCLRVVRGRQFEKWLPADSQQPGQEGEHGK